MSMRTIARSSSNRKSASDLASSVLPTPVGPRNRNEPVGRFGSEMPARAAAYGVGDRRHRGALADQPLADDLLHPQQLGGLALEQPAGRDAGPGLDDVGDLLGADLLADHRGRSSPRSASAACDLLLQLGDPAVEDLAGTRQVALALEPLGLRAQLVDLLAQLADALERGLLALPAGLEPAQLLLAVGEVGAQPLEPVVGGVVGLALERELLHLHPVDGPAELVDLDRRGLDLHPQPRRRLVDEVDRLVGQLPAGDVAVGQHRGRDQGGVGDGDAVVGLVLLLEAAQDRDGVLDGRLADEHLLEPALERRVLLDRARGTRRAWSRRSSAARRGPASA